MKGLYCSQTNGKKDTLYNFVMGMFCFCLMDGTFGLNVRLAHDFLSLKAHVCASHLKFLRDVHKHRGRANTKVPRKFRGAWSWTELYGKQNKLQFGSPSYPADTWLFHFCTTLWFLEEMTDFGWTRQGTTRDARQCLPRNCHFLHKNRSFPLKVFFGCEQSLSSTGIEWWGAAVTTSRLRACGSYMSARQWTGANAVPCTNGPQSHSILEVKSKEASEESPTPPSQAWYPPQEVSCSRDLISRATDFLKSPPLRSKLAAHSSPAADCFSRVARCGSVVPLFPAPDLFSPSRCCAQPHPAPPVLETLPGACFDVALKKASA